jgi:hypothetical protein
MRAVAANADDARQYKDAELKTISIADRLEPHAALSDEFMEHLGICRLGGALDVLYHHPHYAPLEAAVKVKYLAAFLYRGYLVLAKIRRGNRFEPKHYLPLEAFELIDITEGKFGLVIGLTRYQVSCLTRSASPSVTTALTLPHRAMPRRRCGRMNSSRHAMRALSHPLNFPPASTSLVPRLAVPLLLHPRMGPISPLPLRWWLRATNATP